MTVCPEESKHELRQKRDLFAFILFFLRPEYYLAHYREVRKMQDGRNLDSRDHLLDLVTHI